MRIRYAALLAALLTLVGCSDVVVNPLSPEETRRQVVDVSRQLVSDLGGEVTDAQFGYDSCGVNGTPPFQGHASFGLWMPGADRTREVTAESVVTRLRQRGWDVDPNFHTHAMAFKRDGLKVKVWVIPPLRPDESRTSHLSVDVYSECRDTFDHRTDRTAFTATDIKAELAR